MAFTDDIITATSELKITDSGGSVFADIIPGANKAFVTGKLGVGTLNPINTLDVEGATALGAGYSGNSAAPANGLIVEGSVGIGTATPTAKLDVAGALRVSQDASLAVSGGNVGIGTITAGAKLDVAGTMKVSEGAFLAVGGGNVGIGTTTPVNKLDVNGSASIAGALAIGSNPVHVTSGWNGFPDVASNQAEISNDTGGYKTLMIVGNRSAGLGRRVSVWDRLEVNGEAVVTGNLTAGAYAIASGAGGEQAYIGGDGVAGDVNIGSFNAGVSVIGFWNMGAGTAMTVSARDYRYTSDARLKTNIEPLSGALDKVLKLRGVRFDWTKRSVQGENAGSGEGPGKNEKRVGLIAQEVLEVVPEAVTKDGRGMYGISHAPLVSMLIEAVKEQNDAFGKLVHDLEARIEVLEGKKPKPAKTGGRTR